MSEARKDIYDFNKLEDMFEAIDTLTRATAVLASVDGQLAGDLVKMTNTLIELSQSDSQQALAGPLAGQETARQETVADNEDPDDLTAVVPRKQKKCIDEDNDEIIDVLTGEPIDK